MAKLQHPDATSCSVAGVAYQVGADGFFDVPDAAVVVLSSHGFKLAPEPAPEPAPRKQKAK